MTTNASVEQLSFPLDQVGLHIIESGGVKAFKNNLGLYDFDLVNRLDTPLIRQTFLLRNESNFPLANLQLHLAHRNGLQVLVARRDATHQPPDPIRDQQPLPILQAGQELALYVTLDLAVVAPGKVNQILDILAPNHERPVLRLVLSGTLLPVVTFSPDTLNFGRVPAKQTKSLNLTVQIDPRLAPDGSVPRLYGSNPDVHIEPIPLDPAFKRTTPLLNARQKVAGLYSYLLTHSDEASIGAIGGNLVVAAITPPKDKEAKPNLAFKPLASDEVLKALHSVSATLIGTVLGDVSAAPPTVLFGTVLQGNEAVQRVVLTPRTATTLQNVQISSPVPWLSARWADTDALPVVRPTNQLPTRSLDLILSPQAPVGQLQTQLILTLANGQRLVVPVAAFVRKRDATH